MSQILILEFKKNKIKYNFFPNKKPIVIKFINLEKSLLPIISNCNKIIILENLFYIVNKNEISNLLGNKKIVCVNGHLCILLGMEKKTGIIFELDYIISTSGHSSCYKIENCSKYLNYSANEYDISDTLNNIIFKTDITIRKDLINNIYFVGNFNLDKNKIIEKLNPNMSYNINFITKYNNFKWIGVNMIPYIFKIKWDQL